MRAANGAGAWSDEAAPARHFTTEVPAGAPEAPLLSLPAADATDQPTDLTFSWQAVATATSYEIQVSLEADFQSILALFSASGLTGTTHSVAGLSEGTPYVWRVRAANQSGAGAWSEGRGFTTGGQTTADLPAPVLVGPQDKAVDMLGPSVDLAWQTVVGAVTYEVAWWTTTTETPVLATGLSGDTYTLSITELECVMHLRRSTGAAGRPAPA